MSFPAGVATTTCTFGNSYDGIGEGWTIEATVTLVLDGAKRIVWTATGDSFQVRPSERLKADAGAALSFEVAQVDQDGFTDGNGNEVTGWHYRLDWTALDPTRRNNRNSGHIDFSPTSGDPDPLDLDTYPDGQVGTPVFVPQYAAHSEVEAIAADLATHEAASDPHPQYLTPTEGGAAYDAIGAAATAQSAAVTAAATDATTKANAARVAAIADAATQVAAHIAATDPHGDRAWTTAQINALINGAPGLLDTLGEIAAQLASDESAAAALTTTVNDKLAKASNLSDLTSAATARTNLGLDAVYARRTTINVKDPTYGALGDGTTSDTAAINAAIAALSPGDTLLFPPGRYMTDGGHTISTPSVRVLGPTGRGQTFNTSAQLYLRNAANSDMLTIAASQVTIRDLTLHGQFAGQTGTSRGLVVNDGSNYLLVDGLWVTSFNGDGMVFGQTTGTLSGSITNSEARVNQGYGMVFNPGATDTIVSTCYLDQNTQSGALVATGDISFTECHIWGNGTAASGNRDGITITGGNGCRFVNCYSESNANGAGIAFRTGSGKIGQQVIGCDLWNNGFQGLYAFTVSNLLVSGCLLRQNNFKAQTGNGGAGMLIDTCTDFIINGNAFYGPSPFRQTYAYTELNACSGGVFSNNIARATNHGTGDLILSTSGNPITLVKNNVLTSALDTGNAATRAYVAADVVHNNTTSFAVVASLAIKAGCKYVIKASLNVDGAQASDAKFRAQATSSTGASGWFGLVGIARASATSTSAESLNPSNSATIAVSAGGGVVAGMVGVGTRQTISLEGFVTAGSVDGTLEIHFSQQVADATDTTLHAGSWLELVRVA